MTATLAPPEAAPAPGPPEGAPATQAAVPRARFPRDWELLEADYLERRRLRAIRTSRGNANLWTTQLGRLGDRAVSRRAELQAHIAAAARWADRLEEGLPPTTVDAYRAEYVKIVRTAIRRGEPVPDAVIAQRPEFVTAQTARRRYEKGWHTSFANRSAAVSEATVHTRGYRTKRQDGRPILPEQVAEIGRIVSAVEAVVGPLHDLMRKTSLTIAHTSGKHPFLSTAGGLHHAGESISIGVCSKLTGRPIPAGAHELGHWLDAEAGREAGVEVRVVYGRSRVVQTTLLSEADGSHRTGHAPGMRLLYDARSRINQTLRVRSLLSKRKGKERTPDEQVEAERITVHLGHYWRTDREIWARLFEQYVATVLGQESAAADAPERYHEMPGWWTAADFALLQDRVGEEIRRRIRILRGSDEPPPPPPEEVLPAPPPGPPPVEFPVVSASAGPGVQTSLFDLF